MGNDDGVLVVGCDVGYELVAFVLGEVIDAGGEDVGLRVELHPFVAELFEYVVGDYDVGFCGYV